MIAALLDALGDEAVALGCSPSEVSDRHLREALERIAAEVGAEDVFVFRKVARDTFSHLAGAGRGEGWAGNIEVAGHDSRFAPAAGVGPHGLPGRAPADSDRGALLRPQRGDRALPP